MPTFKAERLDTRQNSSSRERPSPSPVRDWSPYLRPSGFDSEVWDTDDQDRIHQQGDIKRTAGPRGHSSAMAPGARSRTMSGGTPTTRGPMLYSHGPSIIVHIQQITEGLLLTKVAPEEF